MSSEIKLPLKFAQPSESTPAKTILVHVSKMESFICSLNPAASLYEDVTDEDEIRACFNQLGEYLKTKNIQLITVEEALFLKGKEHELMNLAKDSLNYERETDVSIEEKEEEDKEENEEKKNIRKTSRDDYLNYSSDEYKEKVLKKFSKKNLMNVILTRPTMKLKHIETDTYIESTSITFSPVGNIVFCRDQQITTKKGVVIGASRTSQRRYEHIIMKQVFKNLGSDIIGDVGGEGYIEGGDFFVAREDLSMLGIGLRSDMKGADYLMKNDLLGTRYMAICSDENDKDQQRMHLDTYFNILNDNNALVIDFDDVKKQENKNKNLDRKVYYYDNDKDAKEIASDREDIKNKVGEYKLIKIYDSFYKFLDDMKFHYIKITHQEQKEYMINFLNIGNNTVISVNKDLEKKLKDNGIDIINVKYFNCQPILNMYGGMHCMTQVSRV
jgi:arginine deiminase